MSHTLTHTSPFNINHLPYELISYIFEIFFFDSHYLVRHGWAHCCRCFSSSVTISQVCQTWRSISTSIPLLWSHISYSSFSDTKPSFIHAGGINPVLHCLNRSGSHLLSVELCFGWEGHKPSPESHSEATLSRLLQTASRWRSLIIWSFTSSCKAHFDAFAACVSALRSLRHLEIREWNGYPDDIPSTALAELPSLVSLYLTFSHPTIVLPWAQVKELTTDSEQIALIVLQHSSEISSINLNELDSVCCLDGSRLSAPIQVADSLQTLIVNPTLSHHFCDAIAEFPRLKFLAQEMPRYVTETNHYYFFMQHTLSRILSKACLLQELHISFSWYISCDPLSTLEPVDFGSLVPNLKVFHLTFIMRDVDYFNGSAKANTFLDLLFQHPNNRHAVDGANASHSFPFPKLCKFRVLLRIDPDAADSGGYAGSDRRHRQGPRPQLLTCYLLRILSAPLSQGVSVRPMRTLRLEYDAPLRGYLETQRASFEGLETENIWETVDMRVLPQLFVWD